MNFNSVFKDQHWCIEQADIGNQIIETLQQTYSITIHPDESYLVSFYDSFTWSLWFSERVFYRIDKTLRLQQICHNQFANVLAETQLYNAATPKFSRQLPDDMAAVLQPLIKSRALMQRVILHCTETRIDIKNEDDTSMMPLTFHEYRRNNPDGPLFYKTISLAAIRGHSPNFRAVTDILKNYALKICCHSPLHAYFETFKLWPQHFSSKPTLKILPDQPIHDAFCEIIKATLQAAQLCENGIIDDIDSEFLHDYRVSIRSIRALISLLGKSFPADTMSKLKNVLSEFGNRTNRLRDLDVYLSKQDEFTNVLPPAFAADIILVFSDLRKQRKSEYNKCKRFLLSKRYRDKMQAAQYWIENLHKSTAESGQKSVEKVVLKCFKKQLHKVSKRGSEIHRNTRDDTIHALRIQIKKLRYLLEFFSSLFDHKQTEVVLGSMRSVQDTLGAFNDFSIQQKILFDRISLQNNATPSKNIVMGALIGYIHSQQEQMRIKIVDLFDQFDTPDMQKNVHTLLHRKNPGTK